MNYNQTIESKELLKITSDMKRYDMYWENDKRIGVFDRDECLDYGDRLSLAKQEIMSLLYYNIISIEESSSKIIWNNRLYYLDNYAEIFDLCDKELLYYIFERLYIKDKKSEYPETYLQNPDYYN